MALHRVDMSAWLCMIQLLALIRSTWAQAVEVLESSDIQGDRIGYYTIFPSPIETAYCPNSGTLRERSGFYYCEDNVAVADGSVYEIGRSCSGDDVVIVERFTADEATGSEWARRWDSTGDLGCATVNILEAWSERDSIGTLVTCQESIGVETLVDVIYITEPTRLPATFTETLDPNSLSRTSTSTIPSSTGSDPAETGDGGHFNSGGTNTGLIAGVVVGAVVGIGLIIAVIIMIQRRKRKTPDDPEKPRKGFMDVLRRIPRPTVTWSRPPDENKGPDSEVIHKAELSTGPETQGRVKTTTTDPEAAELETRERPGELAGGVPEGPFEMDATSVSKEAAAADAVPAEDAQTREKVEEVKTNDTQEEAKKEAKSS
ncbi:hypothetical protein ACHAPT_000819 [Fusarium lateritium]